MKQHTPPRKGRGSAPQLRISDQKIERILRPHRPTAGPSTLPLKDETLRIVPLGGQNGIGEKNMIVVEFENDAIVLDCGFELGIDIPGVNYAIPVTDYLKSIRHKLRGYIISHGHMDHIGGLIHIWPEAPAPIFGSRFTIGMVAAQFEKQQDDVMPDCHVLDMDSHEAVQLGVFGIELVRVTHAIPESSAIVVKTPVGTLVNTGDFRLDPEPLDARPSDIDRLRQLGDEGVLLLMSESTRTTQMGRTPTEHTLQESFHDLMDKTTGRLFVAVFSTNMNRIQMIINAAHRHGRKVALDGRSMIMVAEMAVRLGTLKIPKGTLVTMQDSLKLPDDEIVIICTGGQGEPGAALSRMASGEHRLIKLQAGDTVVTSSTPIPGNEQSYGMMGDLLARLGVKQYRHPTHEVDGSGPLHVSGHASRDEHAEMIRLTRPTFMMPIYGGPLPRLYHRDIAVDEGIVASHVIMAENGDVVHIRPRQLPRIVGRVMSGAHLVDQTGVVVPEVVTRDRLLLKEDGILVAILTVDRTGRPLASPDVITRGYIAIRDNGELMHRLRTELRKPLASGTLSTAADVEAAKRVVRSRISAVLRQHSGRQLLLIPVVNVVGKGSPTRRIATPVAETC